MPKPQQYTTHTHSHTHTHSWKAGTDLCLLDFMGPCLSCVVFCSQFRFYIKIS